MLRAEVVMTGPVAILYGRLGPYHVARIAASAALHPTIAIEFFRDTSVYAWEAVHTDAFPRYTLIANGSGQGVARIDFARRLFKVLSDTKPSLIAIPGWHHYGSLLALAWALRHRTPTVVMSDSQESDAPRQWLTEWVKSRVVRLCSTALVGGTNQHDYVRALGMPDERVFHGSAVIDNDYFAQVACAIRADAARWRAKYGLPERYMLASSRFIEKKNLPFLLRAYARYRQRTTNRAVDLVLVGDGPMRGALLSLVAQLGLEGSVHFAGFRQYAELPAYYSLAEAFVHASTIEQWGLVVNEAMASGLPVIVSHTCGCTPDLVLDGENGYSFDPSDEAELAALMARVTSDPAGRERMGRRSQELVGKFSLQLFGQQLGRAREVARAHPEGQVGLGDWALLTALSLR